jgi:hypothetical protein
VAQFQQKSFEEKGGQILGLAGVFYGEFAGLKNVLSPDRLYF